MDPPAHNWVTLLDLKWSSAELCSNCRFLSQMNDCYYFKHSVLQWSIMKLDNWYTACFGENPFLDPLRYSLGPEILLCFAFSSWSSWRLKSAVRAGYMAETQEAAGRNADANTIPSLQIVYVSAGPNLFLNGLVSVSKKTAGFLLIIRNANYINKVHFTKGKYMSLFSRIKYNVNWN